MTYRGRIIMFCRKTFEDGLLLVKDPQITAADKSAFGLGCGFPLKLFIEMRIKLSDPWRVTAHD